MRYVCIHFTKNFARTFFGAYYDPASIVTAAWDDDSDIRLSDACFTFEQIRKALPADWTPDMIWVWSPEHNGNPAGLFRSGIPVIGLVNDWKTGIEHLQTSAACYDYIFTEQKGVELLRRLGCRNAGYVPLHGFHSALHPREITPGSERDIDVSAFIEPHRLREPDIAYWLKKLCALREQGILVQIHSMPEHSPARMDLMNRSSIVLERSSRGEVSRSAYEAAAAGALLMHEDGNTEAELLWQPFIDYVPYTEANFTALIQTYLQNSAARAAIALSGQTAVREHGSYTRHFELMSTMLQQQLDPESKPAHARFQNRPHELLRAELIQLYSAIKGRTHAQLDRLLAQHPEPAEASEKTWLLNAAGCIRMMRLDEDEVTQKQQAQVLHDSMNDWNAALQHDPAAVIPAFNRLGAMSITGNPDTVLQLFEDFKSRCLNASPARKSFEGLLLPAGMEDVCLERSLILAEYAVMHETINRLCTLLLSKAYAFKGKAHMARSEWQLAYDAYRDSLACRPSSAEARYQLAVAANKLRLPDETANQLKLTLQYAPFHWNAVLNLCSLYRHLGKQEDSKQLAREYRHVALSVPAFEKWLEQLTPYVDNR
ncbi:glycosyltransferase family protein [Paenibacillus thalictri]|uniref:Spore protein YkvP/CgeB glycosyl transferase-like domain-containing protein n=1 Tax=Paenibacillus thalictri TaxID=2527873 RepID=A0A4Q9DK47_9BACL|nr:glycosyltransferase [Paenibacillus thalictri]TBL75104.1 hypothetical protein EYB31_24145 [Paenibacillus thalictri]